MEQNKILSADLLDLLFEGRNKNYGAYELRRSYQQRVNMALGGTLFICLLFIVGSLLANAGKKMMKTDIVTTVELENFKKEEQKLPPPPVTKPEPKPIEMARVTPPKIVADDQVKEEDEVKDLTTLDNVKIGSIDTKGEKDDVVAPPVEAKSVGAEVPIPDEDVNKIFNIVQIPADFVGGQEAWKKFLERNLNSDVPNENGAPPASYTVVVSFVVDRTGSLSDIKAENDPGYGTKAEAIRVLQKSPRWKPAIQNGREVIYRHRQSITFRVSEQ